MVQVQRGNNGMAVFYRDEKHLCGVKCDGNVGNQHPWGQDMKNITEEIDMIDLTF